jgi:hypothetical protein
VQIKGGGGLGVIDIVSFNRALVRKCRWRLLGESLWGRVLGARYGKRALLGESGCFDKGSLWWRDLGRVCEGSEGVNWFENHVMRIVGDGKDVRFWHDKWTGMTLLRDKFRRLYNASLLKEGCVALWLIWVFGRVVDGFGHLGGVETSLIMKKI